MKHMLPDRPASQCKAIKTPGMTLYEYTKRHMDVGDAWEFHKMLTMNIKSFSFILF